MKSFLKLFAAALAVTGCSSVTGPDNTDAHAAKAKANLEAASKAPTASMKLSAN